MIFSRPQDFVLGVAVILAGLSYVPTAPKPAPLAPQLMLEERLYQVETLLRLHTARLEIMRDKMNEAGRSHEILFQRIEQLDRKAGGIDWSKVQVYQDPVTKTLTIPPIEPVDRSMTTSCNSATLMVTPTFTQNEVLTLPPGVTGQDEGVAPYGAYTK